ncbi:sucrase-isomaltase, intestinal-like [Tubulanus polymorphus]|uniref:sucrase-isomaltase, intestinal-like n=1 Tax=Tubulanus polymorphus TaxID=672921 RepID=UPI003DA53CDD
MTAAKLLLFAFASYYFIRGGSAKCEIQPTSRLDCFANDASSTEERCENRGCEWCPTGHQGAPWCYYPGNKKPGGNFCPTEIPEHDRIDCSNQGSSQNDCLGRGCFWCPTGTPNVPWCFVDSRNWPKENIPDSERVDCAPQGGKLDSYADCITKGCMFKPSSMSGAPWCYIPKKRGYKMVGSPQVTDLGYRVYLKRQLGLTMFENSIDDVILDVEFQTDNRLRVKFFDKHSARFEVPLHIRPVNGRKATSAVYKVEFTDNPSFGFKVIRKSTGATVFDTTIGGLVFEDQFLQIATRLPSSDVYGFGEHLHHTFKHDLNWKSWGMYTRDQPPSDNGNLYGVHPYYWVIENGGKAHGVLFLNSNAQDVTLMPAPALTYRTIGGVLDLYILLAENPEALVQEYTSAVGLPFMPPYWSLGFSLANFGYHTLDNMKNTINAMEKYDIPHDYIFGDIDYMDRNLDFTYNHQTYAGLPDYVRQLHSKGMRFIAILDPAIAIGEPNYKPFIEGQKLDVWVKHADNRTSVEGKVWPPTNVYYPDFTNPDAEKWWIDQCTKFHNTIQYDGLWIDMNEPANFYWGTKDGCPWNKWNNPPYFPKIYGPVLHYKTLCPEHMHRLSRHYDVHSLYGWSQAPPTLIAARKATGKRSIVLSRSTFPGVGKYIAHWLGDNWSTWESLRASIIGMMEYTHFGIPFIGADICGFIRHSERNLCNRWQQLGAFYPFSRNHNLGYENRPQDPTSWGDYFAGVARDTLRIRYTLLPYLYTLFYKAHVTGSSVVRPLYHEFPADRKTYDLNYQFMWGAGFMISPVVYPDTFNIDVYFPDSRWYSYYDGEYGGRKETKNIFAPWHFIPLWFRGGHVIPTQDPARTTAKSRQNPFRIVFVLDENERATGSLYWDDGESIDSIDGDKFMYVEYKASRSGNGILLTSQLIKDGYLGARKLTVGSVKVVGLNNRSISQISVNGNNWTSHHFDKKILEISNLNVILTDEFSIRIQ